MYKKYDENEIRLWIEQGSSIHFRAATPGHNDPVELTSDEARSVARDLFELSIRLDHEESEDQDWFRIPMQYLVIQAEQDPTTQHDEPFGGAYVSCWIKEQTKKNALLIAKAWIEEAGWRFVSLDDQGPVDRTDYAEGNEQVQYYDQALIDEEVFVFNTFRKEGA